MSQHEGLGRLVRRRRKPDYAKLAQLERELDLPPSVVTTARKRAPASLVARLATLTGLLFLAGMITVFSCDAMPPGVNPADAEPTFYFWQHTAAFVVVCATWGPIALAVAGLAIYLLWLLCFWVATGRNIAPQALRDF